jgi:hypothetical protein
MSKHDLAARPIYHHLRESIDAHLSIVVTALAVSHWIEHQTGWSIATATRSQYPHSTNRETPAQRPKPPQSRGCLSVCQEAIAD